MTHTVDSIMALTDNYAQVTRRLGQFIVVLVQFTSRWCPATQTSSQTPYSPGR